MLKKLIPFLIVVAAATGAVPVFAATPVPPTTLPQLYALNGTLSHYTAPAGLVPGSVTIAVNTHVSAPIFAGKTMTFSVPATTRVFSMAPIADGDTGMLFFLAPKGLDVAGLQAGSPSVVLDLTYRR